MSRKTKLEHHREKWLKAARKVVVAALQRGNVEGEMCPEFGEADISRETLKKHVTITAALKQRVAELQRVEKDAGGSVGITAMTGSFPKDSVAVVAVCLLAAKALLSEFQFKLTCIGDLVGMAAGNTDAAELLKMRRMCSSDGLLRRYIDVEARPTTRTVDELSRPVLRETALCELWAIQEDSEMRALEQVRSAMRGTERR